MRNLKASGGAWGRREEESSKFSRARGTPEDRGRNRMQQRLRGFGFAAAILAWGTRDEQPQPWKGGGERLGQVNPLDSSPPPLLAERRRWFVFSWLTSSRISSTAIRLRSRVIYLALCLWERTGLRGRACERRLPEFDALAPSGCSRLISADGSSLDVSLPARYNETFARTIVRGGDSVTVVRGDCSKQTICSSERVRRTTSRNRERLRRSRANGRLPAIQRYSVVTERLNHTKQKWLSTTMVLIFYL